MEFEVIRVCFNDSIYFAVFNLFNITWFGVNKNAVSDKQ